MAVVRAENEEQAKHIAYGCMEGGIDSIEITFTVPGAHRVIEALVKEFGDSLLVGAGLFWIARQLGCNFSRCKLYCGTKF